MLITAPTDRPSRVAAEGPHLRGFSPATRLEDTVVFDSDALPSPDELADALRRSTLRAHHTLKDPSAGPEALRAIRDEVAGLETEVDRLGLRKLRPFVASLRRRVEESL